MKKSNFMNENGLLEDNRKKAVRYLLLFVLYVPLLSTFIFFPTLQILISNLSGGDMWIYYVTYYLFQIIETAAFFGLLSLLSVYIMNGEKKAARISIAMKALSLLLIFAVLETIVYYLTALIDSKRIFDFSLSDRTFDQITDSDFFEIKMTFFNLIVNSIVLMIVIIGVYFAMKYIKSKSRKECDYRPYRISAVLIYSSVSFAWHITDNVISFVGKGFPNSLPDILYILVPYVETAVLAIGGYFFMDLFSSGFEKR